MLIQIFFNTQLKLRKDQSVDKRLMSNHSKRSFFIFFEIQTLPFVFFDVIDDGVNRQNYVRWADQEY